MKLFVVGLFVVLLSAQINCATKLLLCDTENHEVDTYVGLVDIAKQAGVDIDYVPCSKLVDSKISELGFVKYSAIFFLIGQGFLRAPQGSLAQKKIFLTIDSARKVGGATIGYLFPPLRITGALRRPLIKRLFGNDELMTGETGEKDGEISRLWVQRFLERPFEFRSFRYHTSLNLPGYGGVLKSDVAHDGDKASIVALPVAGEKVENRLVPLFPLAMMVHDKQKNAKTFVSFASLNSLAGGVTENFRLFPSDGELQQKMRQAVFDLFVGLDEKVSGAKKKKPPVYRHVTHKAKNKLVGKKIRKTAWMEIEPFIEELKTKDEKEIDELKKRQDLLVEYIVRSAAGALWIGFNPQMYFSPIARFAGEESRLLKAVSNFTEKLEDKSTEAKIAPPEIFVGVEIANNLYEPNLPKQCARDLFGVQYPDVPDPLSKDFWKSELVEPVKKFAEAWKKYEVSHGVPLGGVIIDLEMYGRKVVGEFPSLSGFSVEKKMEEGVSRDPIIDLLKKRGVSGHLNKLATNAEELGVWIKKEFEVAIPGGVIGCYAPTISLDWFYRGLYRGLSAKDQPLQLFTFNVNFRDYAGILEKHEVWAKHSGAFMFSKLESKKDFEKLGKISETNIGGFWLNRLSQNVKPFRKDKWYAIEQTPMNHKQKLQFFDYMRKLAYAGVHVFAGANKGTTFWS
ncbi:hypothetical protein HOD08_00510 [bacterium]|nr:hypothetical protein [bacterium]